MIGPANRDTVRDLLDRAVSAIHAHQYAEARPLMRQAQDLAPRDARVWFLSGTLEHRDKQGEAAVKAFKEAQRLAPQDAAVRSALGVALRGLGRKEEALAAQADAVRLAPGNATYHGNLGNLLMEMDRLDEAIAAYRQADALEPNLPGHMLNLAVALCDANNYEEVIELLHRVPRTPEAMPRYHTCYGNALMGQKRYPEAVAAYQAAAAAGSREAKLFHNLGTTLGYLGRLEEAAAAYRKALEIRPDFAPSRRQLSAITPAAEADEETAALGLCDSLETDVSDRADAHFTLAKLYDDRGDFGRAAEQLQAANQLMRTTLAYDSSHNTGYLDRMIRTFTPQFMAARRGWGSPSRRPVFIVGMPRSGTTLVEQILCSHPLVFGAGELMAIPDMTAGLKDELKSERHFPELCEMLTREKVGECAESYLRHIGGMNRDAPYVTDKLPFNFRNLGFIHLLFPQARIIHCRRDPRDIALSCYFSRFRDQLAFSFNLRDLTRYIEDYKRVMDHWHSVADLPYIDVHYDAVVADQLGETRRMLDFLGLEWDDACMRFYETQRPVLTASNWQVRQPLYATSLNRWRNYERMLQPFNAALAATA